MERKSLLIFGVLTLLSAIGHSAEIPKQDGDKMELVMADDMMVKEPVMMEEVKKESDIMEKPVMADSAGMIQEQPMMVSSIEMIKDEPMMEDAVGMIKEEPMAEATLMEEQPLNQMMVEKTYVDRPVVNVIMKDQSAVKEPTMVETMVVEEPLPVSETAINVDDQVATARGLGDVTAADVIKRIYAECVQRGSFACVKPKVLAFLSAATKKDRIMLTQDLSIEKTGKYFPAGYDYQWNSAAPSRAEVMLERIDDFLGSHELKLRVPKEIVSGEMLPFVPKFLLQSVPAELRLPLSDGKGVAQERGFIKKIVLPFLLGLKFKATALIPLAMALIALKTWKALTLGLLSIVLSGAMVIFKFTKPKVVNYEVIHYPHAPAPIIEHSAPSSYDHHGYGRGLDAQPLVYSAYAQA